MKKVCFALLFSLLAFAALLFLSDNTLTAHAVNDLGYEVERLDTAITVKGQTVPADSLKITVTLSNNTGYCNAGIRFPYDASALSVIMDENKNPPRPLAVAGPALNSLMHEESDNIINGIAFVAVAITGMENNTEDGDLITFFLEVSDNSHTLDDYDIDDILFPLEIEDYQDEMQTPIVPQEPTTFEYTTPISYTFMLGDISGDGYISIDDVQLLVQLVNSVTGNELDVDGTYTVSSTTYPGLYISINGTPTLVLRVADVNFDMIVDIDDAWDLLAYYTEVIVSGQPYDGEIGQMQTHVTYIIQFSTN